MAPETGQPEAAVPPGSTDPLLARLAEAGATIQALLSGTLDTIGPAQEAEFRAFFEGSLDAVIVLDDEGRYLAANEAALQLYRTSREELLGSRLERFADPGKDVGPRWRSFLERGRDRGETVLRRADGALRDVEYAAVANYQPGRHLVVARDITASRRDRAALRARLAQQAAVAELGQQALVARSTDDLLDEALSVVAATLGVPFIKYFEIQPDRMTLRLRAGRGWQPGIVGNVTLPIDGSSLSGFTLLSSGPVIIRDYLTEDRFPVAPELRAHGARSGLSVIVAGRDQPFGVLGADTGTRREFTADDIHFLQAVANILASHMDRELSEVAIKRREAKFRAVLEYSSDAVALFAPDGTVLEVWGASGRVLGYQPEDLVGAHLLDLVVREDLPLARRRMAEVMDRPGQSIVGEYRARRRDGTLAWVEVVGVNRLDDPAVGALVGTFRDITDRKEAEAALRESEERFRSAFDSAAIGMALTSTDGRFLRVNPALCAMLGYTEAELLALPVDAITHPSDRVAEQALIEPLRRRERDTYALELRYVHGRGHHVWASMTCSVVRRPDGTPRYFIGQAVDITDRRRAESALRESQQLLERAQAIGHAGSWTSSPTPDGKVTWSAEMYRILGVEPASFGGTVADFNALVHPEDLERVNAAARQALEGTARYDLDHRIIRPDGEVRWIHGEAELVQEGEGTPRRFVGFAQDITDRKLAEADLRKQTEILQAVIDNIPVMIAFYDQDLRPLLINREFERVFGWSLDEIGGRDLVSLCYPDPVERRNVAEALLESDGQWHETRPTARDGSVLDTIWARVKLSDGSRVAFGQDMTERRRLEAQLLQSQKMETVGRLAGGIAHDFNNLLTVIQSNAQFILQTLAGHRAAGAGGEIREDAEEIHKAARRAASLTQQLLTFARRQVAQPRPLNLNELTRDLEKMLRRLIGEDIELKTRLGPGLGTIQADPSQIEQVLVNLAVNARDAMPEGGRLTIETSNREVSGPGEDVPRDVAPGRYVHLLIRDTGLGMTPEVLDHLFEPFFTTKAPGKGTGLGLATCYGIVQQNGGHIWAESAPGRGAAFHVLFPVLACSAEAVPAASESAAVNGGTETLLLVEDEPTVRRLAARTLTGAGYQVLEAVNGLDALRQADNYDGTIDLVVTDVVMPAMGGPELAERLVASRPETRVLFTSGYPQFGGVGPLNPEVEFLPKPFVPRELLGKVREVLNRGKDR